VKVVATLLGLRFDRLWNRHQRRERARRIARRSLTVAAALAAALAGFGWWDYTRTRQTYYADYVERWGVPEGIGKLTLEQARRRSETWKFESSRQRVDRVCRVNGSGRPRASLDHVEQQRPVDRRFHYRSDGKLDYVLEYSPWALAAFNGGLVAAGACTSGGPPCEYIVHWDGSSWQGFSSGVDGAVSNLAVYHGELVATGSFWRAGPGFSAGWAWWVCGGPGDLTGDGAVRDDDFAIFAACLAGPDVSVSPPGSAEDYFVQADLDAGGDVDLADFAVFQAAFEQTED